MSSLTLGRIVQSVRITIPPTPCAVIPVLNQLDYFRSYIERLDLMIGLKKRQELIESAMFVLSSGSNDFIAYSTLPLRRESFSVEGYQGFLLQIVKEFIQVLSEFGARRIVVSGLPPIGCVPIVITLKGSDGIHDRECIDSFNSIALGYNQKLQTAIHGFSSSSSGVHIFYVDPYKPLLDIIKFPASYGFSKSDEGCCGTGLVEAAVLCNPNSLVCLDASKYIFWDSMHPTERAYLFIFNSFKPVIDQVLKSY